MNILFTAPRFHTNQVPIVEGLTKKGHKVKYFVAFVGATEDHSFCNPVLLKPSQYTIREAKKLRKNCTDSEIESILGGHFLPDFKNLRSEFNMFNPDLVICREKTNMTALVKYLCDEQNIPCILYDQEPVFKLVNSGEHTVQPVQKSFWERAVVKVTRKLDPDLKRVMECRNTTGFPSVHMTPVMYRRLPKSLSSEKRSDNTYFIPFVQNTIDSECNREYSNGQIRILSVGKFRDYKNLPILVDSVEYLGDVDYSITIVGQVVNEDENKYYDRLLQKIKDANLSHRVFLKTNVPFSEMREIYMEHDIFVLTSKKETASIAVLEAMKYAMAVISTDYNGTASYIEEGINGYTFQTENPESLAKSIKSVINEGVKLMGQNSFRIVSEKYSFDSYYESLSKMVESEFGGKL